MKKLMTISLLLIAVYSNAQVGVGTTSPNSTLDVRGSMSLNYRAFSTSTSAATTDNILMFTGTSTATVTLPDATTCPGRVYTIKNVSSNGSTLNIATTSSQTVDGLASWSLTQTNKALVVVSNGSGWYATSESLPGSAGTPWIYGGNNVSSMQNFGTTSNNHLPFITNNTERMRLSNAGNLAIGVTTFDGTNPEKLLVDAGTTSSFNVISGKGSINNYLQLNIQNRNTGGAASSDIVATADNGTESVNFVDLGINSSGYSNSGVLGGANRAYLYTTGNDFAIGNSTATKDLLFFTGGTATTNERMRIDAGGDVSIGGLAVIPKGSVGMSKLAIEGANSSSSGPHVQFTTASDNYPLMQILPWSHDNVSLSFDAYWDGSNWKSSTSSGGNFQLFKNADKLAIRYAEVNTQGNTISTFNNGIVLNSDGHAAVGTGTWDGSNPEKFLVDAGTTSSFNVISGKGSINNYLQLNIQNRSNGTAASSDIVATADNGTESVNFVDLGINSSGYSSSGILGGANRAYLYTTGNDFTIGTATASKDLIFFTGGTATGNERMRITATSVYPGQDNTYTMGRNGNRWSAVWSANGTIQTSDIRTKTNIHALPYGLREVMQMKPVAYNWINDPSYINKIGLVAQEVRSIIPEVVIGNEQTETLGMNYAELVPVLVKAIQQQQQQIDELKNEIKELKRKP